MFEASVSSWFGARDSSRLDGEVPPGVGECKGVDLHESVCSSALCRSLRSTRLEVPVEGITVVLGTDVSLRDASMPSVAVSPWRLSREGDTLTLVRKGDTVLCFTIAFDTSDAPLAGPWFPFCIDEPLPSTDPVATWLSGETRGVGKRLSLSRSKDSIVLEAKTLKRRSTVSRDICG